MIYIVRKEHFNAAHKLINPKWSDEKNMEEFGVCSNENWHGHNYEIEVTVKGEVNPETGESKYVELKAPLEVIRHKVKALQKKGFKLVPAINLSCRKLAELKCPCCAVSS